MNIYENIAELSGLFSCYISDADADLVHVKNCRKRCQYSTSRETITLGTHPTSS